MQKNAFFFLNRLIDFLMKVKKEKEIKIEVLQNYET